MTRKPIQIAAISATEESDEKLFALCDDGSMWVMIRTGVFEWHQIEDIPQTEPRAAAHDKIHA